MRTLLLLSFLTFPIHADAPLPPKQAADRMTLPPGFRATLFAGEPDIVQPIAFTFDDRGRMWLVECLSYPNWTGDIAQGKDRVVILEDTDGDGRFDKKTIVWDKGYNLSGIEFGHGGIYLAASPHLLFLPLDGDKLAGPPEVLLDGWSLKAKHNVFSALAWGPDGWLYGCNGILDTSFVGKPGAAKADRIPMNCGVWRFHPKTRQFEPVAWGTTNPWGLDWNDTGDMFITNCVIKHCWHVVPGAHFERMFGQDVNPYVYRELASTADHIHWGGGHWTDSRGGKGSHDDAGGGHAHSGCAIYLGDRFGEGYRGSLFTCNIHGSRLNRDLPQPANSGYVIKHAPDFLKANDPWFRGIAVKQGPDESLFVCDWCDTGECHNYSAVDRTNGRVFKVTPSTEAKKLPADVSKLTDAELVALQSDRNEWLVRHARRVLHERKLAGKMEPSTPGKLRVNAFVHREPMLRLRAVWCLQTLGEFCESDAFKMSHDADEHVRAAVLPTLAADATGRERIVKMAAKEPSAKVRLHLASIAQKLPTEERWQVVEALSTRLEDLFDAYLPLMIWYAAEPLVVLDSQRATELAKINVFPLVTELVLRRLLTDANVPEAQRMRLGMRILNDTNRLQAPVMTALRKNVEGRSDIKLPDGWGNGTMEKFAKKAGPGFRDAMFVAVAGNDADGIALIQSTALNAEADPEDRLAAIDALARRNSKQTRDVYLTLLADGKYRSAAVRALTSYDEPEIPERLLALYAKSPQDDRADIVQALASRTKWAKLLLDAVADGRIAKADLSSFTARQIVGYNLPALTAALEKNWGNVRSTAKDRVALTKQFKNRLTTDVIAKANLKNGRLVYEKSCAACHKLHDAGGDIGPNLTGSQRANLDYLLENVLDPNAVLANEYRMHRIETKAGRVVEGLLKVETEASVTIRTLNETVIVPKNEIEERKASNVSMMPEGLFEKLSADELRDLVAYLASPRQVEK